MRDGTRVSSRTEFHKGYDLSTQYRVFKYLLKRHLLKGVSREAVSAGPVIG